MEQMISVLMWFKSADCKSFLTAFLFLKRLLYVQSFCYFSFAEKLPVTVDCLFCDVMSYKDSFKHARTEGAYKSQGHATFKAFCWFYVMVESRNNGRTTVEVMKK